MGLLRTKARWTIPGAGTAFSVFHFKTNSESTPVQADADDAYVKTRKFFDDLKVALPNQVTVRTETDVEEINEGSGALIGLWSHADLGTITGGAAAATGWSAPTGSVVTWSTAGIRNSRRVRGRTFVVPMTTGAYDTDGTLRPGEMGLVNTAATNIRTVGLQVSLAVWGRPTGIGATDGIAYVVTTHRVPDMCAILTSRRA